jgi:hypothetical protein
MSRTKHVFSTEEIPHLWAHQKQEDARNPQGNLYFKGKTIYSYRDSYPIASHVTSKTGKKHAVLIRTDTYSVTTSAHISAVRYAARHLEVFEVPHVIGSWNSEPSHNDNLAYYVQQSREALGRAERARKSGTYELVRAFGCRDKAKQYAKLFKVACPVFDFLPKGKKLAALKTQIAEREARARVADGIRHENQRVAWEARSERDRLAREERERIEALELPEKIEAWRNGKHVSFGYGSHTPTMLRINGDDVETSRGARFPVAHACKGLKIVEACVNAGREYVRNGHTVHLGHYPIDRIEANGTVHAGCHVVTYAEIQRISSALQSRCTEVC